MTDTLWNCETELSDFDIVQPAWIEYELSAYDVAAILQGGCASGAYMPAVTYHKAIKTMAEHGDDVLTFIEDHYGEIPAPPKGESWSGIAVYYLSLAVELFCSSIEQELTEAIEEAQADDY